MAVDPSAATPTTSASQRDADESDLDPAAFLKSVRELSERREREDTERYRKLEEEIERGRQERAARRAERALSISPEKPANSTPTTRTRSPANGNAIASLPPMTPPPSTAAMDSSRSASPTKDIPEFKGFRSGSRSEMSPPSSQSLAQTPDASATSAKPSPSASSLARSGTLSWQQRPSSRPAGSRPQSMVSASSSPYAPTPDSEPSRDQIAASLGSRDPSWSKQTADRGVGNAAYRKSKDDSASDEGFTSGRRGLPGLSPQPSTGSANGSKPAPAESVSPNVASRTGSIRDSGFSSNSKFSTDRDSTSSKPDLRSLIAADDGQEKAAPTAEQTSSINDGEEPGSGRTLTMSSSQARLASTVERPPSPTKGMGGFVQSAMMKRSDSATKRWSAQPGSSLSRQNSAASARSGYGGLTGSHSMPKLEPMPSSREGSNEPSSRPSSSSSNRTNMTLTQGRDDKDIFVKPGLPASSSQSRISVSTYSTSADEGHTSPPSTPSKRWSPTKSSWLESSITKPESPKPAQTARNSQPGWMADIAKAKAQRASADVTPKPTEDEGSRSSSPTKQMFGQSMLKRSESRDKDTPQASTPKAVEHTVPRSASPAKSTFTPTSDSRSQSRDLASTSTSTTPVLEAKHGAPIEDAPTPKTTTSTASRTTNDGMKNKTPSTSYATTSKATETPFTPEELKEKPGTPIKSPPLSNTAKAKPETPPKPQTDFRSNLRSRGPSDTKQQETPEFLARFGNLKKAQTQNWVAPDVLKGNILRGKSELAKTGGPVKTPRRDELKESLLAKKEQWQKDKEEGVVHERKVSGPPPTSQKPEALAKREFLGRSDGTKVSTSPEKPKTATPEALARQKALKEKSNPEVSLPALEKQKSAPIETTAEPAPLRPKKQTSTPLSGFGASTAKQPMETSKVAAKFNPGLAGILARGPPATTNSSSAPGRSDSPSVTERSRTPAMSPPSEPPANGAQLHDVRKDRAKGPKRRKGTAKDDSTESATPIASENKPESRDVRSPSVVATPEAEVPTAPTPKPKPQAPPGSAASVMRASLPKSPAPAQKEPESEKPSSSFKSSALPSSAASESKPSVPTKSPSVSTSKQPQPVPAKSPAIPPKSAPSQDQSRDLQSTPRKGDVPEFHGFSSVKKSSSTVRQLEDNKENAGEASPSERSAASTWGRSSSPKKSEMPSQILLPSKKDEEAAMRSAGLLASSPSRPSSKNGLGIALEKSNGNVETLPASANVPPKPAKSSRSVSGHLREASPNQGSSGPLEQPQNDIERQLADVFGNVPRSRTPLSIDTASMITNTPHQERVFRTIRKFVQIASQDGTLRQLSPQEEYTFFDESVYVCYHSYSIAEGPKKTEVFLWAGDESSEATMDQAHSSVKKLAKEAGNAFVHNVRQGFEPPGFLQALGGILVTRRGSREHAPKQYMLCGRKHLGQIVFDEVDFGVANLCSGFAYLISYPVTLQETRFYLWKGSRCSTEELSGARLAAMDLSETGEIIEVDEGAEFSSFLRIFGPGTTKASIPKPAELWRQKAFAPSQFATRLFRIQQTDAKPGLFTSIFIRRPSWNNKSPVRRPEDDIKAEAVEISPFMQTDLEADCIYLLDASSELHVLVGPMFASQPEVLRNVLLAQTLLFASEYGVLAASTEDRPTVAKASVLLYGVPDDLKILFRHWDISIGLWGTAGLMAGQSPSRQDQAQMLDLNDVLLAVRKG